MAVTVVVPVYADWPSLSICIKSLKDYLSAENNVLLINDSGPEADELELNIKKEIDGFDGYKYIRNVKNLGFVKTCNKAVFEIDKSKNDILLLNSDTKVTKHFLEEMLTVLYLDDKIAAVTPRSNNATIATVPLSAMPQKGIEPRKSYKLYTRLKEKLPRYVEVPTAHGFCMLVRRSVIRRFGLFDEVFGKGYGEENDFCMRISEHGYKSVLANQAYVYHMEARSFTLERKSELIKQNAKILRKRWPNYKQLVDEYIKEALSREEKIIGKPSFRSRVKKKLTSLASKYR